MSLHFKYKKDKQYFADLLAKGSLKVLEKKYANLFDFRVPSIKRREFNTHKPELYQILFNRAHRICQICRYTKGTEIDHIIPIASNLLNKKFRNMRPVKLGGKLRKIPAESYGSNHIDNLRLACSSCNRKKWHRFYISYSLSMLFF
jgi:5-methylcytosine-specific restriction endonuclease McrA